MSRFAFLAFAGIVFLATSADAGKFNKVLSIGDDAPKWTDLVGIDGKKHALQDLKDKRVVVVLFTCNSCPIAADYEDRILAFANLHAKPDSKVAVVAINANTIPEDKLDKMKAKAEMKKFPFPYLYDGTQEVARSYGAMYTPEFFVLNAERKVVYMGAMDDKTPPAEATMHFLEQAVNAALEGKNGPDETLARGCRIRFNAKRDE
jgi:peroxiredoxin